MVETFLFDPCGEWGENTRNAVAVERRLLLRGWSDDGCNTNTFLPLLWERIDEEDGDGAWCIKIKTTESKKKKERRSGCRGRCADRRCKKKAFFSPERDVSGRRNAWRPKPLPPHTNIWSDKTRNADGEKTTLRPARVGASVFDYQVMTRWLIRWNEGNVPAVFLPDSRQRRCLFSGSRSPGWHAHTRTASPRSAAVGRTGARRSGAQSWNATCVHTTAICRHVNKH